MGSLCGRPRNMQTEGTARKKKEEKQGRGTMQRRLAWPPGKDDTHKWFFLFFLFFPMRRFFFFPCARPVFVEFVLNLGLLNFAKTAASFRQSSKT